uniref:succinate--hydroxymethylglutarate CoA-transferase-like isoform X1 n=1 Tax=Halichoerus grypus TaxID=9711 RepID=UPI001659883B|nr:succinate--hydroxymethylglutarate CoA-transferase-like isoform X1 [Halichoerus grypus]
MTSKWLYLFEGSGVAYGPINDMKNVFAEPQVLHNGLIMEMKHPTVGKISVPVDQHTFSGTRKSSNKMAASCAQPPTFSGMDIIFFGLPLLYPY